MILVMGGVEAEVAICGDEAGDDSGSCVVIQGLKEDVVAKLDGMEVFAVVAPVASLLHIGV